jgi:hypothetical protein
MKFFKKFGIVLALSGLTIFIQACASTDSGNQSSSAPVQQDHVSTVPWNRPASWEGSGQLGGMMGK